MRLPTEHPGRSLNMKPKIMVIDDDAQIRQSLLKLLTSEGYDVVLAADGTEALTRFDPKGISILLLDLNLPMKSGWDVFEEVSTLDPLLPIIIITGRDRQYDLSAAVGVGALMEKPLNIPLLLKTIRDLLAETPEQRLKRLAGVEASTRYFPAPSFTPQNRGPSGSRGRRQVSRANPGVKQ